MTIATRIPFITPPGPEGLRHQVGHPHDSRL